jgi:HSP20 family protein
MLARWYDTPVFHRDLFQSLFDSDFFKLDRLGAPQFTIGEENGALVLRAQLPGMTEKDLSITAESNTLTISGQRQIEVPEGYRAIRRERIPLKFSRSFTLSRDVSLEAAQAKLENGILTLSIPKRPEAQPRQIAVKAS